MFFFSSHPYHISKLSIVEICKREELEFSEIRHQREINFSAVSHRSFPVMETDLIQNSCENHFINFYGHQWLLLKGERRRQTFMLRLSKWCRQKMNVSIAIHRASEEGKEHPRRSRARERKAIKVVSLWQPPRGIKLVSLPWMAAPLNIQKDIH